MQPNGKEPSELMEEMARYAQLLRGHLGLTEEILENMHQITITMGQKWQEPDAEPNPPGGESQEANG